jgi:hypothetical protein
VPRWNSPNEHRRLFGSLGSQVRRVSGQVRSPSIELPPSLAVRSASITHHSLQIGRPSVNILRYSLVAILASSLASPAFSEIIRLECSVSINDSWKIDLNLDKNTFKFLMKDGVGDIRVSGNRINFYLSKIEYILGERYTEITSYGIDRSDGSITESINTFDDKGKRLPNGSSYSGECRKIERTNQGF